MNALGSAGAPTLADEGQERPVAHPYPDLVRARIARGWDPETAAATPFEPRARLTAEEVERIRAHQGRKLAQLARELGVSQRHVRRIRSGRAWKPDPHKLAPADPCPQCGRSEPTR